MRTRCQEVGGSDYPASTCLASAARAGVSALRREDENHRPHDDERDEHDHQFGEHGSPPARAGTLAGGLVTAAPSSGAARVHGRGHGS